MPTTGYQRNWNVFTVLVLLVAAIWIWLTTPSSGSIALGTISAPSAGFFAPDFSLQSLNGDTYTLSDFRGKPVLVNIWATWCPPCRSEMPAMQRIYEQYQSQGFVILAVNLTQQDSLNAAQQFIQEHSLTFPVLLDVNGEVADLYKARVLPSSFFIFPDGRISEVVYGGPMAEALLNTRVEALLSRNKQ